MNTSSCDRDQASHTIPPFVHPYSSSSAPQKNRQKRTVTGRWSLRVALLAAILCMLGLSTIALAQEEAKLDLGKGVGGGVTEVQNGTLVEYLLAYSCSTLETACVNTTLIDTLPPGVVFVDANGTQHVASITPDSPSAGRVTIDFIDPLPGGSSGIISIFVRFPPGTIPADLPTNPVTNTATIDADNAAAVTASAPIRLANGSFQVVATKRQLSPQNEAVLGVPIVFELEYCNIENAGAVNFNNAVLTDLLPPGAEFLSAEPNGVYDAGAHSVTWTNLAPNPLRPGQCVSREITIVYNTPPTLPPGALGEYNTLAVTGTPDGCQPGRITVPPPAYCVGLNPITPTVTITDANFIQVLDPFGRWGIDKSATTDSTFENPNSEALPGESVVYDLNLVNSGYLTITNVVITDTFPAEVALEQISFAPFSGTEAITVSYSLRGSGGLFVPFPPPGPVYTSTTTLSLADLGLPPGSDIALLRWEVSGTVQPQAGWRAQIVARVRDNVPDGVLIQNCVTVAGATRDGSLAAGDCVITEVIGERSIPRVLKSLTSAPSGQPTEEVGFDIVVRNANQAHLPAIGPTMMDLLPATLAYVPGTFALAQLTPLTLTAPLTVEAIPDFQGGRTLLRAIWAPNATIPPGASARFAFTATIVEGTPPSVITNTASLLTEDNPLLTLNCSGSGAWTDTGDYNSNGDTTEQGCASNANVGVDVQLNVDTQKYIRGQYDLLWTDFGRTPEGGFFDYRLVLTNTSNVPLTNIGLIDIFPHINDTGVIDPAQRGSVWQPTLQSRIEGAPGIPLTVWYSREQNPCRPRVVPGGGTNCVAPNWSLDPPLNIFNIPDITLVRSVAISFCSGGTTENPTGCYSLPRNTSIGIQWRMSTPSGIVGVAECIAPTAPSDPLCPKSWNSFAFTASGGGLQFRPAEPPKVGIGVLPPAQIEIGDFVWLDVPEGFADGIQQPNEPGINGVRVALLDSNTMSVTQSILTANDISFRPGYYRFLVRSSDNPFVRIAFQVPPLAEVSPAHQGGDDFLDSDGTTLMTLPEFPGLRFIVTDPITVTFGFSLDLSYDQGLFYPSDFGDAPQALAGATGNYPTSWSATGGGEGILAARHIVGTVPGLTAVLGTRIDDERDGAPSVAAQGDDLAPGEFYTQTNALSDEDGVRFPTTVGPANAPMGVLVRGVSNNLVVSATIQLTQSVNARLHAWIDLNRDGDWLDSGEKVYNNVIASGTNSVAIAVPASAALGDTYMRFRLASAPTLAPTGTTYFGEVEDYRIQIVGDPVKSIVLTSEVHTPASTQALGNNTQVAIGEIVRYRLSAQLPRGQSTNFRFVDDLPPDVSYLGNPTVILTATNPLSITGLTLPVPGVLPATPTVGGLVTFTLGTITNNSTGAAVEYVAVEFNALVRNTTGNQDTLGTTARPNVFSARFNSFIRNSNSVQITVVEPLLTQTKAVVTAPSVDGGDVVTYTIVTRAGTGTRRTTAFDVVISDTVNSMLTLQTPLQIVNTAGVLNVANTTSGNLVNLTVGSMTPGSAITVTFRAVVNSSVRAGITVPNRVRTTWTSLPGPNGTLANLTEQSTPGSAGAADGERNGSSAPSTGGLNNYFADANAPFVTARPSIRKLQPPNPWTIGQPITFTLVVTTPEGTTPALVVIDNLPAGLLFESGRIITAAAASGGLLTLDYLGNVANVPPVANGNDIVWSLGDVVNPPDNNRANDRFLVQLRVVVANVIGNQHGVALQNVGRLRYTDGTTGANTEIVAAPVTVNLVEPTLRLTKSAAYAPLADAGDLITYTLTLRHSPTSTITAYTVRLIDTVPADLTAPLLVRATYGAGAPVAGVGFTGNSLRVLNPTGTITLPYTETVTIVYTARFADSSRPGIAIQNTAGAVWATLPITFTERRWDGVGSPNGQDLIGSTALNNYEVNASALVTPSGAFTITKQLINSDALHTTDPNLTIGESVTYTLRVTVTEGTLLAKNVVDTLPAGMRLVSTDVITRANPRFGLAQDFAGVLTTLANGSTPTQVVWNFGSVLNPGDNNPNNNTFLIRLVAVVENLIGNQQPGTRSNTGTLTIEGVAKTSNPVVINLVEPVLAIDKRVATPPLPDAGDPVTYTIVLRHTPPSIEAQRVVVSDTLPALVENYSAPLITSSSGRTLTGAITGGVLRVPAGTGSTTIAPTETITIVVRGTLADAMRPGQQIDNSACVSWASLPDGLNDADRRTDGDGLIGQNVLNNYRTCDTASFTPAGSAAISKRLINSNALHTTDPNLTIGESVTYTLRVTITEGTVLTTTIVDALPAGMRLAATEVITQANARLGLALDFGGVLSGAASSSTPTQVAWSFDSLIVTGDNNPSNNTFLIRIEAVVENVIGNQQPGTRTNTATLTVEGASQVSNPVAVNIVEPVLAIDKRVTTATPNPEAGDAITYTIVVRHTPPSISAQNVVISDSLPLSLDNFAAPIITSSTGRTIVGAIAPGGAGPVLRVPVGSPLEVAPTEVITILIRAVVADNALPFQPIVNTACATWASLPNGLNDADRRTDGDGLISENVLNNYATCDAATFIPGGAYGINKALVSSSAPHTTDPALTIGEVLTYSLRIAMSEATWLNTVVTDVLPAGLVYLPGTVALDTTGFGGTVNAPTVTPPPAAPNGGGNLVLAFGTVGVIGNNDPADNSFAVTFQARVMDIAGNVGLPGQQSTLINRATLSAGDQPHVDSNEVFIVAVEPRMEIRKTVTPTIAPPQSIVTFTVAVSNTGLSTAFESLLEDIVPVGVTYVPGTLSELQSNGAATAVITDTAAPLLQAWYSVFPTGTQSVLSFQARLDATLPPGTVITNTATISNATTLPGEDPYERTEPDSEAAAAVTVITHDLVLTKTNGRDDYEAGGLLTYTITITNVGQAVAPGVTITEVVPISTTFVAPGSSSGWGRAPLGAPACATGDPAGTVCIIAVGDIQPGAMLSVTFVVRVDVPLPQPAPVILNAACVDDDGTLGTDPTPANNCDNHTNQYQLAQLGDRVWLDENGNGIQDPGENGYAGMAINLFRIGTPAPISSTTSAADGSYYFTNLPPGDYQVEFVPPLTAQGVRDPRITFQFQGSDPTVDSDARRDDDANGPAGFTEIVTLAAGEVNPTIDAGVYYLSALGDFVWHDLNANGLQEAGEAGIPDVTLILLRNGTPISTTTTNVNGYYIFSDLDFAAYRVQLAATPGYLLSPAKVGQDDTIDSDFDVTTRETREIVVNQSLHFMNLDAGLHQLAALGDRVWSDTNANGIQDTGEPGLANVLVKLTSPTYPGVNLAANTTITGSYLFTALVPGQYVVHFAQPAGVYGTLRYQGSDPSVDSNADPNTGFTDPVTLISAQIDPTIDAGFYPSSRLGDFVWEDRNANGIQEAGEPGIANVGVELLVGGAVISTTVTDANGLYLFDSLRLGTYAVRTAAIPGWRVTLQNQGSDPSIDSDIDPVTRTTAAIVLALPGDDLDNDAGYYEPAQIGDYTWRDLNANGIQDAGEPPLAGVTVVLEAPDGTPVVATAAEEVSAAATIVTAADGRYLFTGLTPGEYRARFTPPAAYRTTLQRQGSDPALDSDPDQASGLTPLITVTSGEINRTIDGGYFRPAELGSYVWLDININGIRESGEPPVADVTVNLYREGDSAIWRTTATDASGTFLFTELPPGRYRLRFDAPTGLAFTWRNVGSDPMLNSDVNPATGETDPFDLADGQSDLTWGAGLILPTNDPVGPEPEGGWQHRQWLPAVQGQP